jgi:hypothetical protein
MAHECASFGLVALGMWIVYDSKHLVGRDDMAM